VELDEMSVADMAARAKIRQKNKCDTEEAKKIYSDVKDMVDRMFADEKLPKEEIDRRRIKIFQTIMG
jgi:hypothetical protein